MQRRFVLSIALLIVASTQAAAQSPADPELLAVIKQIKAIDNHAHPLKVVRAGEPADHDFDAYRWKASSHFRPHSAWSSTIPSSSRRGRRCMDTNIPT